MHGLRCVERGNNSIANHLNFNVSKCKYMIISRRRSPTLPPSHLHLLGDPLQRVECYKYLGLLSPAICRGQPILPQLVLKPNRFLDYSTDATMALLALLPCTSAWFAPTLTMHAKSGILTLLKTRRNWRTCKGLPAGWHHTNGMLATITYYNCTNYQLWRSVDCT